MEKSYDDLSAISNLVSNLTQKVNDSAEHISKLQSLSKDLVPPEKYDELLEEPAEPNLQHNEEDDEIRQLEQRRLKLVMSIQKQDFLSDRLIELISQNQEIIDSVKDYLLARESIRVEEEAYIKKDIETFVTQTIKPVRDQLILNQKELHSKITKLETKLTKDGLEKTT